MTVIRMILLVTVVDSLSLQVISLFIMQILSMALTLQSQPLTAVPVRKKIWGHDHGLSSVAVGLNILLLQWCVKSYCCIDHLNYH